MIERIKLYINKWWALVLVIGGVLGALNNYPVFLERIIPPKLFEPDIQGIWLGEYSYPISNGSVEINGTTEYFRNKRYNFVGEIGLSVESDEHTLSAIYYVDAAGVWQADSETISISLGDMASSLKSVSLDGEVVDRTILQLAFGDDDPIKKFMVPSGTSEEYEIIEISERLMILETDDPAGNDLKIEMIKQSRRFQR